MAQRQWNYVPTWCRWLGVLAVWLALGLGRALAADEYYPSLTLAGNTFSNVTIISRTATHLSFKHSGGFASVRMSVLPPEEQTKVGYTPPPPPKSALDYTKDYTQNYTKYFEQWINDPRVQNLAAEIEAEVNRVIKQNDTTLIYPALGGVVCIYFLFCLAVVKICRKTTVRPGIWAWLPGFQFISLFKAAGMSPWSYLLLYIPLVNLILMVRWCFKICRTRQKSPALGFFLLLPIVNIFAFFYLAFSRQKTAARPNLGPGKLKLSFQTR